MTFGLKRNSENLHIEGSVESHCDGSFGFFNLRRSGIIQETSFQVYTQEDYFDQVGLPACL